MEKCKTCDGRGYVYLGGIGGIPIYDPWSTFRNPRVVGYATAECRDCGPTYTARPPLRSDKQDA